MFPKIYQTNIFFSRTANYQNIQNFSVLSWNYSTKNEISFFANKIYLIYLMAPIDFTKDQNTMYGVI